MRARPLLITTLAAIFCCTILSPSLAGKQRLALFPPQAVGVEDPANLSTLLGQALRDSLRDRFDVQLVTLPGTGEPGQRKERARSLGATYVLTGNVTRIGRTASLDITLAPTESPDKGRTVFVTVDDRRTPSALQGEAETPELPPAYREMATQASAKLTDLFFGDGRIGVGGAGEKIPSLSGTVGLSRNLPGQVVSIARGDTDLDGKPEVAVAFPDAVAIYRTEGDDLVEKARIHEKRGGIVHIDVGDVNRNGIAEVIVVRYLPGSAVSDIWEYDGTQYRRIASEIPYFLRTADLGPEGIVLLGQASDSMEIYKGPVFRLVAGRNGDGKIPKPGDTVPLPEGTWIYSFAPVKFQGGLRYVVLGAGDRLLLLNDRGEKIWESIDRVTGTDLFLESAVADLPGGAQARRVRRIPFPSRLFPSDLDGDGNDEIVLVNNIVQVGGFFVNLRIYTSAEVLCFGQLADSLQLAWRTAQVDAPAMDTFLDAPYGSRSIRVGVASRDKAKILGEFGEWRLYWMK